MSWQRCWASAKFEQGFSRKVRQPNPSKRIEGWSHGATVKIVDENNQVTVYNKILLQICISSCTWTQNENIPYHTGNLSTFSVIISEYMHGFARIHMDYVRSNTQEHTWQVHIVSMLNFRSLAYLIKRPNYILFGPSVNIPLSLF